MLAFRVLWWRVFRHPAAHWLLVVGLAGAGLALAREGPPRSAGTLGPLVRVPVAARELPAGARLGTDDVVWRSVPRGVLPRAAPSSRPVGSVAAVPLAEGEVLLEAKLRKSPVPAGTRALAVAVIAPLPALRPGDLVDVIATFEVTPSPTPGPTAEATVDPAREPALAVVPEPFTEPAVVVAARALVVSVDDDAVTVAVPVDTAPKLAFALARAVVTLALSPPDG